MRLVNWLGVALLSLKAGAWKGPSWLKLVGGVLSTVRRLEQVRWDIDFSAGAGGLSSPEKLIYVPRTSRLETAQGNLSLSANGLVETPLLLAHQMGKRIVKKLPDSALLGVLVLIASELLQREVNTKFLRLPPILRELVNSTALELDTKLEFLSSLQWDVDPFLRAEIENLQNQPLELVDKFVVQEILPRVDKELSPVLSNLIGDPRRVQLITRSIKDLIQSASVVLLAPGSGSIYDFEGATTNSTGSSLTSAMMKSVEKSVDRVGETVEEAIKDWNNIIIDLTQLVKAESIVQLIPESLLPSFKKPYTKRTASISVVKPPLLDSLSSPEAKAEATEAITEEDPNRSIKGARSWRSWSSPPSG